MSLWLIGVVVVAGLYLYDRAANAAAASLHPKQLPVGPSTPTKPNSPSAAGYLTVVPASDAQTIYASESNLAALVTNGIVHATYSSGNVEADSVMADHGLSDPVFIAALSAAQKTLNTLGDFSKASLPFSSVRTDGVLDYATAAALNAGASEIMQPPPRVTQNVAPFVAGAPNATYNIDASNVTDQSMNPTDTLTITVPSVAGVTWAMTISDTISDADPSNSAVYPFGNVSPGLASQGLGTTSTQTFGFLAVRPGTTKITLTPSTGGGAVVCTVTVA
jgi:hypothetical protein